MSPSFTESTVEDAALARRGVGGRLPQVARPDLPGGQAGRHPTLSAHRSQYEFIAGFVPHAQRSAVAGTLVDPR